MVEKISNTKEVSSEYQKIETKLVSHIDSKISRLFKRIMLGISVTSVFSSLFTVSLLTVPLIILTDIASGSEAFYFTLEKATTVIGITIAVIAFILMFAVLYESRKIVKENPL